MHRLAAIVIVLVAVTVAAQQISYYNEGLLRQPSAAADRAYLGITNGVGFPTNGLTTNFFVIFGDTTTNMLSFVDGLLVAINPPPEAFLMDDLGNFITDENGNKIFIPL